MRFAVMEQKDVPSQTGWIHPSEKQLYDRFTFDKRRNDWLLGRWTAKNLLQKTWYNGYSLNEIAILPGENRAPFVYLNGQPVSEQISISHSHGMALCATNNTGKPIGCDLEKVENRSPHFLADYFTRIEREILDIKPTSLSEPAYFSLCWSAKEAVMKALRTGLSLHPLKLEITQIEESSGLWKNISVQHLTDGRRFTGVWKLDLGMVFVLISDEASSGNLP